MFRKLLKRIQLAGQALRYGRFPPKQADDLPDLTEGDLQEVKRFFSMPKFFIFGHARSGTTLLARLIRVHPEVHCNWQAHFFTREPTIQALVGPPKIREWLNQPSFRWNDGEDLSPRIVRVVADFILERQARNHGKTIVGDKSPNHYMPGESVRSLHKVYPDAKLVFIIRDGRDTVLSHRFQVFIDFPEYLGERDLKIRDDFSKHPEPFYAGQRSLFTETWLQKDIRSWVDNVEETTKMGKELFGERFFTLKYEELVAQPIFQMHELWSFLEVSDGQIDLGDEIRKEMDRNPDAEWQRQQDEDLLENLEKGKSGRWEDLFTPNDRRIVKGLAGETLIDWGYEDDNDW